MWLQEKFDHFQNHLLFIAVPVYANIDFSMIFAAFQEKKTIT